MELLIARGTSRTYMPDRKGVIHTRRDDLNEYKCYSLIPTTYGKMIDGADVFVGVSGPSLAPEDLKLMADKPVVFACSNPDPEISF